MKHDDATVSTPVDSAEGMAILLAFARNGNFVLQEFHERLALKYGLDTSGVTFARQIPKTT